MNHLWQRFLLACALLAGLAIGVGATVFGYSNLQTVDIHWSVFRLNGVPLWTVAVVPIALVLIFGTIYHWLDGLHHFTEHMRHRHRVRELESEVARLRAHLDQVLEMPRQDGVRLPADGSPKAALPAAALSEAEPATLEPMAAAVTTEAAAPSKPASDKKKRPRIVLDAAKPGGDEAAPEHTNGADAEPALPDQEA